MLMAIITQERDLETTVNCSSKTLFAVSSDEKHKQTIMNNKGKVG